MKHQRILTIRQTGDSWKGTLQPQVSFGGKWLREAGFQPGDRYIVTVKEDKLILEREVAQ